MFTKRLEVIVLTVIAIMFLFSGCSFKKEIETIAIENSDVIKNNKDVTIVSNPTEKKYDLYSATPYDIPLFSIVEMSKLPLNVKKIIDNLLEESQGFYFLRFNGEKVLIIFQNPVKTINAYPRHELQFAEVDLEGNVVFHNAGYVGVEGETKNLFEKKCDSWIFVDLNEITRPLKHIAYDEKGNIKFSEIWNYDEKESIKYQMKDSNKKTNSILKESQDNDSNFRKEHIFYDNDGNITMSLTINFDGANISRLTFYNSHDSIESISIISEYTDGLKTKESVYNEDYELINTVKAEYVGAERKKIVILDENNEKISEMSS